MGGYYKTTSRLNNQRMSSVPREYRQQQQLDTIVEPGYEWSGLWSENQWWCEPQLMKRFNRFALRDPKVVNDIIGGVLQKYTHIAN